MSEFSVTILGCGSATPSLRHNPSCQVVDHRGTLFMIDCGEGSQLEMRRRKIKFSHLRHIFISHLHGDHFLGLPGLLSTLSLHEQTGDVHVYTFPEGIALLKQILAMMIHEPSFNIVYHELHQCREVVFENSALTVETIPLYHRMPAVGFLFREKTKPRPLRADMLEHFNVPVRVRSALKLGADFVMDDGTVIENSRLTFPAPSSMSYAYCSDTTPNPRVAEAVSGVSTLYHEATYADDKAALAPARGHSTARQAAQIARQAGVERLVIGHFSKSYNSEDILLAQAREEFPNTIAANEGMKIELG